MPRLFSRLALVLGLLLMLTVSGWTVSPPSSYTPAYAIVNARIVPVTGSPIESGTLVMRRGRIAALGADVQAPSDAIVVDGRGWTLYPGFIDAHSGIGMPQPPPAPANPFAPSPPQDPSDRPSGLNPEALALELYEADADALQAARKAGFTAALTAPRGGVFSGRSAVIALRDGEVGQMVLRDRWAQQVGFERLRGRYPGTIMGAMALIRQRFSDAQWYRQAWSRYRQSPVSVARPEYDAGLEALEPYSAGQEPVVFTAWTENEILRALKLASELNLKAIVSGATEGWRAADELKAAGQPVFVSLDLSPRQGAGGFGRRGGGAEQKPSQAEVREAEENAGRLHSAGIPVAFSTAGLDDLSKLLPNLRKVVEAGMPEQAALEALTIQPARALGIDAVLGSLEVGKAAHVVAVAGGLFSERGRVAAVWVDGRQYEAAAPGRAGRGRRQAGLRGRRPGRGGPGAPAQEKEEEEEEEKEEEDSDQPDRRQLQERRSPHGPLWPLEPVTAIRHATLLTASNGTISPGTILIRDGKIAAMGKDSEVEIPSGAREIDASGMYVTPGIIDAHSHMAITGGGNESSQSVTPEVRIDEVINHRDASLFRALAGGVTTINVLHGSANVIGGQNAVIKLRWGKKAADLFLKGAPRGVKFALGENPKRSNSRARPGADRRYPGTRMGVEYTLRKSFAEAREYQAEWREHEAARQRGEDPLPPRRDLRKDALVDILEGRIRVHAHCYRSDEILMLLRVAEDFGFRISSLQHVLEGYKVADEIAAHGAGASTFADNWAYKMEALDAIPYNMAIMAERGVTVSVNSDSGERVRRLYLEAAKAIKYGGISEEEALKMITLNPALHLGIEDRVGSLEVGKDADLALFIAHPFSAEARVQYTFVDGQVYFDRDKVETTADALARPEPEVEVEPDGNGNGGGNGESQQEERPNRRRRSFEDRYSDWNSPQNAAGLAPPTGYGDIAAPSLEASKGILAIKDGRILSMAGPPIEKGTVLIQDGRITAVGANLKIPRGAKVINARGMTVTPGMINTGTSLGLSEIGSVAATQDTNEIEDVNAVVKASVALNPHSEMLPITRANGVTTAVS
ncbi:MAG: amidohydrolase family protein, partial [Acidobacteriota bacterium]